MTWLLILILVIIIVYMFRSKLSEYLPFLQKVLPKQSTNVDGDVDGDVGANVDSDVGANVDSDVGGEHAHSADNTNESYSGGLAKRLNVRRKVTLHYTNWCSYCQRLKPTWNKVKNSLKNTGVEFIESDEDVKKTEGITSYPTIMMLDEYGNRHKFEGDRTVDGLKKWILSPALP